MTTRIIKNYRVVWANGSGFKPAVHNEDVVSTLLPPAQHTLRVGTIWRDPEDDLNYRIVEKGIVTAQGGWGTADFWISHLKTQWHIFRELVLRGCFDAAVEDGTGARRYRMLDPTKTNKTIEVIKKRKDARRFG